MFVRNIVYLEKSSISESVDGFTTVSLDNSNMAYAVDEVGNRVVFEHKYREMLPKHLWHEEHFHSNDLDVLYCSTQVYNSGALVSDTTNPQYNGALWIRSSSTANSGATIYFTCPIRVLGDYKFISYAYMNPQASTTTNVIGYRNNLNLLEQETAGMYFEYSASGINAVCRNTDGVTSVLLYGTSDEIVSNFNISVDSSRTNVTFELSNSNGDIIASTVINSNIPDSDEPMYVMASSIRSVGGLLYNMLVDYMGFGHVYGWTRRFTS